MEKLPQKSRIHNEFLPKSSQKFPIFNFEITLFLYFIQVLIIDKYIQKKMGRIGAISKNPDQLAEVSAEVFAEVSASFAEVSASFAEVSASFAEVSAVHSQKFPRFTRGNFE